MGRTVSGEEDAEGSETDAAGEAVRHSRRAENSEGGVCLGRCSARPRPCSKRKGRIYCLGFTC